MASRYPLCAKAEEGLDHVLVHCPSVWGLWATLISIPSLWWVCPYLVKDLLSGWSGFPIRERARKLWLAAPLSLIWAIWKERNRVVLEDGIFSLHRLELSFISALISWAGLIDNVECSFVRILLYSLSALSFGGGRFLFLPFLFVQAWCPLYTPCILRGSPSSLSFLVSNILPSLPIKKKKKRKKKKKERSYSY